MKQRIPYIDLAKGICILLVVLDHIADNGYFAGGDYPLNEIFEQLRMPLYFILSGLFFKDYAGGLREFLLRKTNKILIPYLFFLGLYIGLNKVLRMTLGISTGELWAPLWFLLCLYWMNGLFAATYHAIKRCCAGALTADILLALCMLVFGTAGYLAGTLPFRLGTALTCVPFLWAGYVLNRRLHLLERRPHWAVSVLLGIVLLALLQPLYQGENYFYLNSYAAPLPLVWLAGLLGTLGVLQLSSVIRHLPVISYIGRYSIIVLCTHLAVTKGVIALLHLLPQPQGCLASNTAQSILVLLLTLSGCIICCHLGRKYLPWFTAQKDLLHIHELLKTNTPTP